MTSESRQPSVIDSLIGVPMAADSTQDSSTQVEGGEGQRAREQRHDHRRR